MCGIHFTLLPSSSPASPSPAITARISQRGPDHLHTHRTEHPPSSHTLTFTSSVLSLRGPPHHPLTRQPLTDAATGSVLCWNGEAWRIAGTPLDPGVNDAQEVFRLLLRGHTDVPGVLQSVEGPWAMVYWDAPAATLWYGRDVLGRRSLLWRRLQPEGAVEIASVGDGAPAWEEVGVLGLCWVGVGGGDSGVVPWVWEGEVGTGRYMRMPFGKLDTGVTDADAETGPTEEEVQAFGRLLKQSVHTRVRDIPPPPQGGVRLAVLFSGGLDCTVLARLAHDSLPPGEPIDLLNVAFENPRVIDARRKHHHNHNTEDPYELCPDRITGRRSHAELTQVCPGREWRLVAINVPLHTLREHRDTIVSLMHPHNTEMDLSIAAAFYFASRGATPAYTTPARTLLSGLGADELLGGYARHATAFRRAGAAGLAAELQTDVARLGRRNLGRDDRVLAHWGREARYPFLDEAVVAWCVCARIGGKRDKGLLRALAAAVGLPRVAAEPKRAVQFGSRSARMQGGRVKGTMQLAAA